MDIFAFDSVNFLSFVLTFMRVSLIVFLMPFFGGGTIPTQAKAAVCLVLTIAVWPEHSISGAYFPAHPINLAILMLGEVILGVGLSLMLHFIFAGVQLGGQIIGFQMGFSMLSIGDPSSNEQLIITSFLAQTVTMALFLSMDGHILLLHSLMSSFTLVPPGSLLIDAHSLQDMISLSAGMFVLALKVAGPIMACLFMVELALALMARTAPQMNLLVLGFPLKIGVGFMFLGIMFSLMGIFVDDFVRGIGPMFDNFMRSVNGG